MAVVHGLQGEAAAAQTHTEYGRTERGSRVSRKLEAGLWACGCALRTFGLRLIATDLAAAGRRILITEYHLPASCCNVLQQLLLLAAATRSAAAP
jgi:hypothetical protein